MPGPALAVGGPSNITYWGRSRRSSTDRFAISRSFQNSNTRVSSSGKLTLLDTGLNIISLISLAIHSTRLLPVFNRHSRAPTRESIPPRPPVIPAPEPGIHPREGPLTLSRVEGSSGGRPGTANPSRHPTPSHASDSPVIPRPRDRNLGLAHPPDSVLAQQKIPPLQGRDCNPRYHPNCPPAADLLIRTRAQKYKADALAPSTWSDSGHAYRPPNAVFGWRLGRDFRGRAPGLLSPDQAR